MATWSEIKQPDNTIFNISTSQAFYERAFYGELYPIWKNTPFVYNQTNFGELKNMSFHRALAMMMRNNETGETARRTMLYYYLLPYYDEDRSDKTIDLVYPVLSSDNTYLIRAMKNQCILYDEASSIEIKGTNDKLLSETLQECNWQAFMQKFYLLLKFTNQLLYRPSINLVNGETIVKHKIYTADKYRAEYDDYGSVTNVWIPKTELNNRGEVIDVIYRWSANTIKKYDTDLKELPITFELAGKTVTSTEIENTFKILPFVEAKLDMLEDSFGEQVGGAYFELLRAQLDCNGIELDINQNIAYDSFKIRAFINFNFKKGEEPLLISPGRVFTADQDIEGTEPPHIQEYGGGTEYLALHELKLIRMKQALKNMGLPSIIMDDNTAPPDSGVALKEMRKELMQLRLADINPMKRTERQMIKLLIDVLNIDPASDFKGKFAQSKDYEINIDYGEIDISKPFVEVVTDNDTLLNKGYIPPIKHYKELTGDTEINTNEQLLKAVKKNIELTNKLKELTNDRAGLVSDSTTALNQPEEGTENAEVIEGNDKGNIPIVGGSKQIENINNKEGAK